MQPALQNLIMKWHLLLCLILESRAWQLDLWGATLDFKSVMHWQSIHFYVCGVKVYYMSKRRRMKKLICVMMKKHAYKRKSRKERVKEVEDEDAMMIIQEYMNYSTLATILFNGSFQVFLLLYISVCIFLLQW